MNHRCIALIPALCAGIAIVASAGETEPMTSTTSTTTVLASDESTPHAGAMPMSRLVARFSTFAGSTANADSLVEGLRTGTAITLVDSSGMTKTTFTPPTRPMGWGNVKIALALAQAELAHAGITHPTPADIEAALNGGTVVNGKTSTTFAGILVQRADGMGWGQIAHADDLNLGAVVRGVSKPTGMKPMIAAHSSVSQSSVSRSSANEPSLHGHGIVSAGGTALAQHSKMGRGVVTASGNASETPVQHGHTSGLVTAAGPAMPAASVTTHAAVAMTTASGESVSGGVVTAIGAGTSTHGNSGHGKGHGG
jgi:hypothetical protein